MDAIGFIHGLKPSDIPENALREARRCLLDTIGVAAGAMGTDAGRMVRDHAAAFHGAAEIGARMLFDGRRVAPPGAAMAGAATIDSLDSHDGHNTSKGHVGVTVLPALLAFCDEIGRCDGAEFMTRFVLGYEIATRAGIALHATVPDYHTSGAWNALGAAAIGARTLGLDRETTRHALGIAEYYGPRSQMMRVIDNASMLKDGSAMGAFAGVSAVLLAARGFTGAPAITVEDAGEFWTDLGDHWAMEDQFLKPHPVCRWAQPAVEAALSIRNSVPVQDIEAVRVVTFHQAVRLAGPTPRSTDEAQYSISFPVAAALVHGRVGPAEIDGAGLRDPEVLRLGRTMTLAEDDTFNARFPVEFWGRVEVTLKDGRVVSSEPCLPRGDPRNPLTDGEVAAKFEALAGPVLGTERSARLAAAVEDLSDVDGFFEDLLNSSRERQARSQ